MAKTPKKTESEATTPNIGKEAITSNTTVASLAMEGASTGARIVVYACYGFVALGLVALLIPPYEAWKQITCLGAVVVALLLVLFFVVPRYHLSKGIRSVRDVLIETRETVYRSLKKLDPSLSDEQVRANIFLPEYGKSASKDDYVLKIVPGLHLKMENENELGIVFHPGEGATGKVFESNEARVTQRLDSAEGQWDEIYKLTDEQLQTIHSDLQWIISMPIKGKAGPPVGVMNIDGLGVRFHPDQLYGCMFEITPSVILMGKCLPEN